MTVTPAMTMSALSCCTLSSAASKVHIFDLQLQAELFGERTRDLNVDALKAASSVVISYGGKAALVDMMSLPASTVVSPADAAPAVSSPAASLVSAASEEALSAAGSEAAVLSEEAVLPQASR